MCKRYGKFGKLKREAYLDCLRDGMTRYAAAENAAVNRETIRILRNEDAEFADQEQQAEIDGCAVVESALMKKIQEGNMTAIQVWLYNRSNGRWGDKRSIQLKTQDLPQNPEDLLKLMKASDVKVD